MLLGAVSALLFTDPGKAVTAMIAGSHAAVKLSIELCALYGFWLGFFGIVEKTGIADFLGKILHPVVKFLFPGLSKEGEKYVTMNMAANLLGLGNASTPMAIKAIREMEKEIPKTETPETPVEDETAKPVEDTKLRKKKKPKPVEDGSTAKRKTAPIRATKNMKMLTVISCTSLQLLPTTVIGLRATHGAVNPVDFLLPATVATIASTVLGITAVKLLERFGAWRQKKREEKRAGESEEKRTARLQKANKQVKKVRGAFLRERKVQRL